MNTNTELVVQVSQEINANVEDVYTAWTNAEALKHWCTPLGFKLKDVSNEAKKGGKIKARAINEKEELTLEITGDYEEVQQYKLLVYSWNWKFLNQDLEEALFKISVKFTSLGSKTKIELTQENLKDEIFHVHQQGWQKAIHNLDNYLANNKWDTNR